MTWLKNRSVNVGLASALILTGLSLSGCATEKYVDEHVAVLNTRIDSVDAKAQDAIQRADAANSAAQAAAAAAQAAAADARTANQRLDQLSPRVDTLEQQRVAKTPRH
ncbi:MAG: Lpp/OprI family alanine-zipper lipoprotein [Phenylobacterium sp.]